MTGNDDEQVGDRWEEDEDWGSLEVRWLRFGSEDRTLGKDLLENADVSDSEYRLILTQEPDKTRTDPEDWNTDWAGIPSSKKKASDRGVGAFLSCYTSLYPEQHWLSKPADDCRRWPGQPPRP